MNFDKFLERYTKKMKNSGVQVPEPTDEDYNAYKDRVSEIYMAFVVYSEFQNEVAEEQRKEFKRQQKLDAAKQHQSQPSKIILPNGRRH
jgi:hypothetical protein